MIFEQVLVDRGYAWVVEDVVDADVTSDREYYEAIIRTVDASLAPGSETSLLGDALDADGFADDPEGTLAWWLDAYRAWELAAERDEETQERVAEAIFSGRANDALALVTA